jgi:hypothetical protein
MTTHFMLKRLRDCLGFIFTTLRDFETTLAEEPAWQPRNYTLSG